MTEAGKRLMARSRLTGYATLAGLRILDASDVFTAIAAIETEAVAARDAEIAAAVRALDDGYEGGWGGWIERAAVLAIIEGTP